MHLLHDLNSINPIICCTEYDRKQVRIIEQYRTIFPSRVKRRINIMERLSMHLLHDLNSINLIICCTEYDRKQVRIIEQYRTILFPSRVKRRINIMESADSITWDNNYNRCAHLIQAWKIVLFFSMECITNQYTVAWKIPKMLAFSVLHCFEDSIYPAICVKLSPTLCTWHAWLNTKRNISHYVSHHVMIMDATT